MINEFYDEVYLDAVASKVIDFVVGALCVTMKNMNYDIKVIQQVAVDLCEDILLDSVCDFSKNSTLRDFAVDSIVLALNMNDSSVEVGEIVDELSDTTFYVYIAADLESAGSSLLDSVYRRH